MSGASLAALRPVAAARVRLRAEERQERRKRRNQQPNSNSSASNRNNAQNEAIIAVDPTAFCNLIDDWFLANASQTGKLHSESGDDMIYLVHGKDAEKIKGLETTGEKVQGNASVRSSWFSRPFAAGKGNELTSDTGGIVRNGGDGNVKRKEPFFVRRLREVRCCADVERDNPGAVNWEETLYLNVLLHKFRFTVEVSIRRNEVVKGGGTKLALINRVRKHVFAVPNRVRMDHAKAQSVEYTYPVLFFAVDDFNEAWRGITLTHADDMLCVELFADGDFLTGGESNLKNQPAGDSADALTPSRSFGEQTEVDALGFSEKPAARKPAPRARVFAGAVAYSVISEHYKSKTWMFESGTKQHFFRMKGPHSHGGAEVAICSRLENKAADPLVARASDDMAASQPPGPRRWLGGPGMPQTLHCMLTSLCLPWDMLLNDLFEFSASKS